MTVLIEKAIRSALVTQRFLFVHPSSVSIRCLAREPSCHLGDGRLYAILYVVKISLLSHRSPRNDRFHSLVFVPADVWHIR